MLTIFLPRQSELNWELRPNPSLLSYRQRATKASVSVSSVDGWPIEDREMAALIKSLQVPLR